jgi:hypothetical protein
MAGHDAPVMPRQPDVLGLGDQVADGEHEAVLVDDDARAFPLGAEYAGGEGVIGDASAQRDDGMADVRHGGLSGMRGRSDHYVCPGGAGARGE